MCKQMAPPPPSPPRHFPTVSSPFPRRKLKKVHAVPNLPIVAHGSSPGWLIAKKVILNSSLAKVVVMSQNTSNIHYTTYFDSLEKINVQYLGGKLLAGQVGNEFFSQMSHKKCYSLQRESSGAISSNFANSTLNVQANFKVSGDTIKATVGATAGNSSHTIRATFNDAYRLTKVVIPSYRSGNTSTVATTVTLSYPASLPSAVPISIPKNICK